MTYPLIELIDEVYNRISKAKTSGNLECKDIFIGEFEHIRKPSDYPIVVIAPVSTEVSNEYAPYGIVENVSIRIMYAIAKKTDNNNKLYKTSDTSGALYELAKILNYIEKSTSDGSIDLDMNAKANKLPVPSVNFDYSQPDSIRIMIDYTTSTRQFQRGSR